MGASYYPDFEKHLTLTWDVLQFRAPAGATRVVAAVGVRTADAGAFRHRDEIVARAELFLVDTVAGTVDREESVRRFAAGPLPPFGWLLLQVQLDSHTSRERPYRLSITDRQRRAGAIVGGSLAVRDYAGGALMLSDLVLAPLDAGGSFERGRHRIALAPGREFGRAESLALYYEVYGLVAGDAFRTEIAIEPQPAGVLAKMRSLFPGAPETLRLSFDEEAGAVHGVYGVQQLRTVGLAGLVPGTYRLRVTVTDARARSTVRERMLYVGTGARE